ncbi:hypothetical protein Emed_006812 [Eimeria media]
MEGTAAATPPSAWGPPTTVSSFLLQAFACPAPWAPHYVPPAIHATFLAAGFPSRKPPLGAPLGGPLQGILGALGEVLADCTLAAEDAQYKSILTFGSYNKFEKPNLPELVACIVLIALGPLTSQQLHLFIENRLRNAGGSPYPSGLLFIWRALTRVFAPLSLFSFGYICLCCSSVSTPLAVAAALAAGCLLSLPSLSPETLSPLIGAFLVPCYAFTFGLNIPCVVGAQVLFCLLVKLTPSASAAAASLAAAAVFLLLCAALVLPDNSRDAVSLTCCCRSDSGVSTLKKGYFVPFADHRTMQMIVTCIAILAVDFLTFPRKYCKSVNSGVTLMDLGVGISKTNEPLLAAVARAASQSSVLGLFGLLRLIFMSLTNLHVSDSEYGLHWNFYMTLMVVFVCYQAVISFFDLEEWMMEGPRTSFLCLFLIAVSLGHFFVTYAPLNEATKQEHSRLSSVVVARDE